MQSAFNVHKDDATFFALSILLLLGVPLILLLLAMKFSSFHKGFLLIFGIAYYLLAFFQREPMKKLLKRWCRKHAYACPYCKSPHTVELGLREYIADLPYYWYSCCDCVQESVFLYDKLVEPAVWKSPTREKRVLVERIPQPMQTPGMDDDLAGN